MAPFLVFQAYSHYTNDFPSSGLAVGAPQGFSMFEQEEEGSPGEVLRLSRSFWVQPGTRPQGRKKLETLRNKQG